MWSCWNHSGTTLGLHELSYQTAACITVHVLVVPLKIWPFNTNLTLLEESLYCGIALNRYHIRFALLFIQFCLFILQIWQILPCQPSTQTWITLCLQGILLKGTSRKRKPAHLKLTVWCEKTKLLKVIKKEVLLVRMLYTMKVNVVHGYKLSELQRTVNTNSANYISPSNGQTNNGQKRSRFRTSNAIN